MRFAQKHVEAADWLPVSRARGREQPACLPSHFGCEAHLPPSCPPYSQELVAGSRARWECSTTG